MKDEGGHPSSFRPSSLRRLLIGGGHSHLFVLEDFARQPPAGLELVVVVPSLLATYSGMVPGELSGQYPPQPPSRRPRSTGGASLRPIQSLPPRFRAVERRLRSLLPS